MSDQGKKRQGDQRTLRPLADYRTPAMPTDETVKRLGWKVWQWWRTKDEGPFIAKQALEQADVDELDRLVAPPACGPILCEFTRTFEPWLNIQRPTSFLQLVVLPPCDQIDVLTRWAEQSGHQVVHPPDRDHIQVPNGEVSSRIESIRRLLADESAKPSVVVVPRIEGWMLRKHDGLTGMLELLAVLSQSQRHCIVGCGSWAWKFLCKSTQASLILPSPMTFEAFDCERLKDWLLPLASIGVGRSSILRFSDSGKSVFGDDASDETTGEFFKSLAARSRGIPWVAWHLWRQSLCTEPGESDNREQKFPEERTIWVSALAEFTLPAEEADAALLILHSLLIHESLTLPQIERTLPSIHRCNVLSGLIKAGFVEQTSDFYRCSPAAYPSIRQRLSDSGFPLEEI